MHGPVLNRSLYFQVQIEAHEKQENARNRCVVVQSTIDLDSSMWRDVTHQLEYPEVGVTELTLSNGMQVCYKSTDFLDDQVLFTGFAYGGLSELPESDYISCSMGSTIAGEIGMFGYKPSMLMDMLAGGDIGCGSGDEFIIFPPSGRVEDKQTLNHVVDCEEMYFRRFGNTDPINCYLKGQVSSSSHFCMYAEHGGARGVGVGWIVVGIFVVVVFVGVLVFAFVPKRGNHKASHQLKPGDEESANEECEIFRLSLCQTSSYNTTSVGLTYSHVNTSSSPRKRTYTVRDLAQQNGFDGLAAYRLEKSLQAQLIDMKIAGNISGNLEACKGEMKNRGALPKDEQNDNKTKINSKKNGG
ncbi:hypothetical protein F2Q69_00020493 [Brassica cretica]|uniref:Uncharacterized protein n=1 Tax=Brassica cretica TaxID=69181 RepID=A0A8S9Q2K1_BRACR|nr:hypothetical protein F2Q69_00020493 [Brassica cretica]